jgi:hypothetical protein
MPLFSGHIIKNNQGQQYLYFSQNADGWDCPTPCTFFGNKNLIKEPVVNKI